MTFPFWVLFVVKNPEDVRINAATAFQTEAECVAAKRVAEKQIANEKVDSFNMYPRRSTAICKRLNTR